MTMNEGLSPEKWYERAVHQTPDWSPLDQDTPKLGLKLPHGVKLCAVGVVFPEDEELDVDQWMEVGKKLVEIDKGMQWALGEWWAIGDHKYGDKALIAKELKYDFKYLATLGWVARSVPTSSRRELLSWSHHKLVAKFGEVDQEMWLKRADEQNWTVKTLEQKIRDAEKARRDEGDSELKKTDPDGYRQKQSRKIGMDAVRQFEKIANADPFLASSIQRIITDEQFLADLPEQTLSRLIRFGGSIVDMFSEAVSVLEEHQKERAEAVDAVEEGRKTAKARKKSIRREFLDRPSPLQQAAE